MEQLSDNNTSIHSLHPMAKLLSASVFIVAVVSFDRYAFGSMIPYIFYTVVLMALSEIPYSLLLKRVLIALPFCLFAGISNMFFDRAIAFTAGSFSVSYGAVSLFTILFRTYLCVMAVLILVATTPFGELTMQLRQLKVPNIFVTMFEMTYRYIGVLLEEVSSMHIAYTLRSTNKKGIDLRHMGSFVGQLLLRSFDRAERIYSAMKCRGYALHDFSRKNKKLVGKDIIYLIVICALSIFFRVFDVGLLFISWFGGLFSC